MSLHWSLLTVFLTIFIFQVSHLYSTPISNENLDLQHTQHTLHYLIQNILTESNNNEQIVLLNQLREYLNRMCIVGYFGSSRANACQRIADIVHQINRNDDENNVTQTHDNEQHGIQKRFFCNGFIGCKSAGR
jgi:hypothetical protein